MLGSGWEALLDVQEWSGCSPECPGVVERPSRKSWRGWEACQMFGSGQKSIPKVRE